MVWNAYTDLMPTAEEVGDNLGWALRALLKRPGQIDKEEMFVPGGPGAERRLLLPYGFEPDRQPDQPKIVLPDGMFGEALEELKDGRDVAFHLDVHNVRPCQCTGRRHRLRCELGASVVHAVASLMQELQVRTRTRLAIAPAEPGKSPLMLDDHDGLAPPTVRFRLVVDEPVLAHTGG